MRLQRVKKLTITHKFEVVVRSNDAVKLEYSKSRRYYFLEKSHCNKGRFYVQKNDGEVFG